MKYHQDHGSFVNLPPIDKIDTSSVSAQSVALGRALQLEQKVLNNLILINQKGDPQTQVFIEDYISM